VRLTTDSEFSSSPTLPTPAVAHLRNHDEDLDAYQTRRQDFIDGKVKGMPGASLGVAVRMQQEGLELLRSPKASEGQGGALGEAEALKRGNTVGVRDQVMDLVASQGMKVSRAEVNLPTPTVSDLYTANLASTQQKDGSLHSVTLAQVFHREDLFPTPTTQDAKNTGGPSQFDRNTKPLNTQVLVKSEWGKFEPAIRRWEQVIGRPAPEPTKPDGKEGNHRLSSSFTEWMMGVPEGWITGAGISRNEELKAAGNGVVPQQAELALRILLAQTDFINDIE
jgi:DNA (cytosine-5)-methyltransferase 1